MGSRRRGGRLCDRRQQFRALFGGAEVARIPVRALTKDAPVYQRPAARPARQDRLQHLDIAAVPEPKDLGATLKQLLARRISPRKSGSFVSTIIMFAATPWWRPAPMPR